MLNHCRWTLIASVVTSLFLAMATMTGSAEELFGLEPLFGDGKLTVVGSGFKQNEQVSLDVKTDSERKQLTVTADAQGSFRLVTGMTVKPLISVERNARGSLGSGMAAITSVPLLPGTGVQSPGTTDLGQLPRAGEVSVAAPLVALVALGLLGAGLTLRRSARRT